MPYLPIHVSQMVVSFRGPSGPLMITSGVGSVDAGRRSCWALDGSAG